MKLWKELGRARCDVPFRRSRGTLIHGHGAQVEVSRGLQQHALAK